MVTKSDHITGPATWPDADNKWRESWLDFTPLIGNLPDTYFYRVATGGVYVSRELAYRLIEIVCEEGYPQLWRDLLATTMATAIGNSDFQAFAKAMRIALKQRGKPRKIKGATDGE